MSKQLTIGWLYPKLMNIYGDRGNLLVLQKRCQWRDIVVKVELLDLGFEHLRLKNCNLILMGGAQDREQEAVVEDLFKAKDVLNQLIEHNVPGLYVCGAYQLLGNYYQEANGQKIKGLGIFDLYTKNPGKDEKRLIGNACFKPDLFDYTLLGFENHGGRTYLEKNVKPFGKVIKGFGNNAKDNLEGAVYKNSFGTYLHGPLLSKNPLFADYLIEKALEIKYKAKITLQKLDDTLEENERIEIAKHLQIEI
ncbi:MAG: cobalamin biosynthesis protein CobQ [Patescibacteria group bacterium]